MSFVSQTHVGGGDRRSWYSGGIERHCPWVPLRGKGREEGQKRQGPPVPLGQRRKGPEATPDSPPHTPWSTCLGLPWVSPSCSSSRRLWAIQSVSFLILKLEIILILPSQVQSEVPATWGPGQGGHHGGGQGNPLAMRACASVVRGLTPSSSQDTCQAVCPHSFGPNHIIWASGSSSGRFPCCSTLQMDKTSRLNTNYVSRIHGWVFLA